MKGVTSRATATLQSRSPLPTGAGAGKGSYDVEADEMADEAQEEKGSAVAKGGRRTSSLNPDVVCYDSAGEWASEGSDGLTPVLRANLSRRRSSGGYTDPASASAVAAVTGRSLLFRETAVNRDGVGHGACSGNEQDDVEESEKDQVTDVAAAATAVMTQTAGESALEESIALDDNGAGGAPGKRTAPPPRLTVEKIEEGVAAGAGSDVGGEVSSSGHGSVSPRRRRIGGGIREKMKMFEQGGELPRGNEDSGVSGATVGSWRSRGAEDKGLEKLGGFSIDFGRVCSFSEKLSPKRLDEVDQSTRKSRPLCDILGTMTCVCSET